MAGRYLGKLQRSRRQVEPVKRIATLGQRELSSQTGPAALAAKKVHGRCRHHTRPGSVILHPASADKAGLRVDPEGSLHLQAVTIFTLKSEREDDLGTVALPGQVDELKRFRLPLSLPELLHQGTFFGAGR